MSEMNKSQIEKLLQRNEGYLELLKARLPNSGINYKYIQAEMRSIRAVIVSLKEKLGI